MNAKDKKNIDKHWKETGWVDLNEGIDTMREEIKGIVYGENFTFITDEKDNIRKWVELEKAYYTLELIARKLRRIAHMNAHFKAKQLIKEVMENT